MTKYYCLRCERSISKEQDKATGGKCSSCLKKAIESLKRGKAGGYIHV